MAEIKEWKHTNGYEVGETLPPVTPEDNGKVLGVSDGAWGVIEQSGGGGSEPLIVTVTYAYEDGTATYTCNKTWKEIHDAYLAGTIVLFYEHIEFDPGDDQDSYVAISTITSGVSGGDSYYLIYAMDGRQYGASTENDYPVAYES